VDLAKLRLHHPKARPKVMWAPAGDLRNSFSLYGFGIAKAAGQLPIPLHQREALSQVNPAHLRVAAQLLRRSRAEDHAFIDDVGPVRDG
jgi:hypothetical protein